MFATVITFIIILGFLVFVHELGHFVVARFFGVKAEEFGFGFPPRIIGVVYNERLKKWEFIRGNQEVGKRKNTIYSLNWIPLGGFVKILGEDGGKDTGAKSGVKRAPRDSRNFSAKPIWQRIAILAAGVIMNVIGAIFILSIGFYTGLPQVVSEGESNLKDPRVQIVNTSPDSPAAAMKLAPGDEIVAIASRNEMEKISEVSQVVNFLEKHGGDNIVMEIKRGDDIIYASGTARKDPPEGQGALGIVLTKTAIVSYPLLDSIKMATGFSWDITALIVTSLFGALKDVATTGKTSAEVSGPVGIFVLADQAAEMGISYLLQFAAVLSINLAIINILPIPALDGGRIIFLLIEKIKKSPVSADLERKVHMAGFYALIMLMLLVTAKDVWKFRGVFNTVFERIQSLI